MKFKELIDELEEFVEDAQKVPLSNKCVLDKEEIFNIVQQIRLSYPEDIKQAEYVKKERDRILADAEKEAQMIIEETKTKVAKMVDENEITRLAKQKAAEILGEAQKDADDIVVQAKEHANEIGEAKIAEINTYQDNAVDYVSQMLQRAESSTENSISTIAKSIEELNKKYDELRMIYDSVSQN